MSSKPGGEERTRFALVDGLRALAHLSLLLFHCTPFSTAFAGAAAYYASWAPGPVFLALIREYGPFSTALFFVLSGFLATLAVEQDTGPKDGRFWARFYVNRVIRFAPILWLVVFLTVALLPDPFGLNVNWWRPLLFVGNCIHRFDCMVFPANHTWTTSTDFQFYLLLPLLLPLLRRLGPWSRHTAYFIVAALCVAFTAVRIYNMELGHPFEKPMELLDATRAAENMASMFAMLVDMQVWYHTPWARLTEFVAGVVLAFDYIQAKRDPSRARTSGFATALALAVIVAVPGAQFNRGLLAWPNWAHRVNRCVAFPAIGWALAQLVRHLMFKQIRNEPSWAVSLLTRPRPWRFVADISYASYCIHLFPVPIVFAVFAEVTRRQVPLSPVGFLALYALCIAVTFPIAALLHYKAELPLFRRLKPAAFRLIDAAFGVGRVTSKTA